MKCQIFDSKSEFLFSGLIFENKCNESELVPVYGGLTGFIGIVLTGFWMSISCCNREGHFGCETHKILFFTNFVFYAIFIIMGKHFLDIFNYF